MLISSDTDSPDSYSLSGPAYLSSNGKMQINAFVALANGIGISSTNWTVKLIFNVPVEGVLVRTYIILCILLHNMIHS